MQNAQRHPDGQLHATDPRQREDRCMRPLADNLLGGAGCRGASASSIVYGDYASQGEIVNGSYQAHDEDARTPGLCQDVRCWLGRRRGLQSGLLPGNRVCPRDCRLFPLR